MKRSRFLPVSHLCESTIIYRERGGFFFRAEHIASFRCQEAMRNSRVRKISRCFECGEVTATGNSRFSESYIFFFF